MDGDMSEVGLKSRDKDFVRGDRAQMPIKGHFQAMPRQKSACDSLFGRGHNDPLPL